MCVRERKRERGREIKRADTMTKRKKRGIERKKESDRREICTQ